MTLCTKSIENTHGIQCTLYITTSVNRFTCPTLFWMHWSKLLNLHFLLDKMNILIYVKCKYFKGLSLNSFRKEVNDHRERERNVSNPIYFERCSASIEWPIVEVFTKRYRLVFYVNFEARLNTKYFLKVKTYPHVPKNNVVRKFSCFLLKIWVLGPYLLV